MAWLTDDRTWCGSKCNITECDRHPSNITDKTVPHSYAMFGDTEICPVGIYAGGCIQRCPHWKDVYAKCGNNIIRAVRYLVKHHCDECEYSEVTED